MKQFTTWIFAGLVASASAQTPPATPVPPPATQGAGSSGLMATPDPNQVVLTIGNDKITAAQYDALVAALPAQLQSAARGPQKRQFAERIIQLKVLAKEAEKRSVDQDPTVKQQLAFDHDNILAGALYQDMVKNVKIDDQAIQKYYNDNKADFETVKGRHILIRFKGSAVPLRPGEKELSDEEALAKAQDIRKQLQGGADFANLAKAQSDDTGSGANGGDLGTFKHGQMVPAFETAAFALPVGQISEPVKTQFGYHIIKIDSKESKSLVDAKSEITAKLAPDMAKQEADDLRKKTPVVLNDAYFGPAMQ